MSKLNKLAELGLKLFNKGSFWHIKCQDILNPNKSRPTDLAKKMLPEKIASKIKSKL